jgi:hypothetical protein
MFTLKLPAVSPSRSSKPLLCEFKSSKMIVIQLTAREAKWFTAGAWRLKQGGFDWVPPFAELGGLCRKNATQVASVSLKALTGWLRLRSPPSQSSGGSIGGQQNGLLSEFPMSLYYSRMGCPARVVDRQAHKAKSPLE